MHVFWGGGLQTNSNAGTGKNTNTWNYVTKEIQINASPASPDFRIWAPVLFRLQVSAGSDASYYVCVQYLHITCKNMCEHFQASDKPFDLCTILERTYLYAKTSNSGIGKNRCVGQDQHLQICWKGVLKKSAW